MKKIIALVCVCMFAVGSYAQLITGGQITTTTTYQVLSDTGMVRFVTNVPANLKIDDTDMGEVQSTPYKMKYGQYKATLTAENYYPKRQKVQVEREKLSTYNVKLLRKRKPKPYPVRTGLQQEVNLNYSFVDGFWHKYDMSSGLVDYVIGWRFNNWFFLGAGTGLHIHDCGFAGESFDFDGYKYVVGNFYWDFFKPGKYVAEIPLYLQAKVYMMNSRVKPFMLTSLGGRFDLCKVPDNGVLFNIGPGVEFNINERYAVNLSFLYELKGMNGVDDYKYYFDYGSNRCTSSCPYYEYHHYHYNLKSNSITHGFSMRVGFVF